MTNSSTVADAIGAGLITFNRAFTCTPPPPMDWAQVMACALKAPVSGTVVVPSSLLLSIESKLAEGRRDAKRLDALEKLMQGRGGLLLHTGQDPECVFGVGIGLATRPGASNQTLREAIDRATEPG